MKLPHRRQFLHLAAGATALTVAPRIAFAQAAKRCGITQPSLTNAMKRLEDLLGGPLFHRAWKPASVTEPTGLALVVKPYFEQAHLAVEAAQHKASKLKVAKHALMVSTQEE
jgi:LysR family hydrogen peroxide-inducible transcriptional activator